MDIKVENLNFYYGDKQALFDINLDIKKKQITALIGPSGCGKSTFLRTINRMNDLIPHTHLTGSISIDNHDILSSQYSIYELRKEVGMVFQKPNPFPKSIYDNIVLAPKYNGIRDKNTLDEIVETSLRKASLWDEVKDKLKKSAIELSGGQQQRLCIARCIAMKPEIILMDEPTSALDPIATAKIEDLILELKESHTIVIVTHSMAQASRVSDQTAFFLNGVVVEYDETANIFGYPKDKRTEDYVTGRFG